MIRIHKLLSTAVAFSSIVAMSGAFAQGTTGCIEHGPHSGTVFFLVDRSDKRPDTASLAHTTKAVKEMVKPGQRVIIGTSSGKKSDTNIVLDVVRPAQDMWASVLKIRAAEKRFSDCFASTEAALIQQNEESKTSALLETMTFVADVLRSDAATSKRLVIFSDMIQHTDALNFYSMKTLDPVATLAKVEKSGLAVNLKDVTVSVAGAGAGVSDEKARSLEAFWRRYFEGAGADVAFFGPLLIGG
jgi:hypothetical protein